MEGEPGGEPPVEAQRVERAIIARVEVPASVQAVWEAWTSVAGVCSFLAPAARIDLRPGGAYEMLFDLEAAQGQQGGEGNRILALQPPVMLSFTWNAPPELPKVREQKTHVCVRLTAAGLGSTHVTLNHDGWGEGGAWEAAFAYFEHAWSRIVLPRLRFRFEHGPIDWSHPPNL